MSQVEVDFDLGQEPRPPFEEGGELGFRRARNRIVNPAMHISQQNDYVASTVSSFYPADQWFVAFSRSAGVTTTGRIQLRTPRGSMNRIRVTNTSADTSLAATEYLGIWQRIEGIMLADLLWGTADAKQVILRFGFKGPAGTYAAALKGASFTRSYVVEFTIDAPSANIDTEQTFIIPGDTSGGWLVDNNIGVELTITMAAGTTYQTATPGAWVTGQFFATASTSNGMATAGAVYELFDVGLYMDPENTGIAPNWELPDEGEELRRCQRYWQKFNHAFLGAIQATTNYFIQSTVRVDARPGATLSGVDGGITSGFPTTPAAIVWIAGGTYSLQESRTSNSGITMGSYGRWTTTITVNGRL